MNVRTQLPNSIFASLLFVLAQLAIWNALPQALTAQVVGGAEADLPVGEVEALQAAAYFTGAVDGKPAMLHVTAEIAPGWHTYSITQPSDGPVRTEIRLAKSTDFTLAGEFKTSTEPEIRQYDVWPNVPVEEHEREVTWSAPIKFSPGVDVQKLKIAGSIYAQVCATDCLLPTDYNFVAELKGPPGEVPAADTQIAQAPSQVAPATPPRDASEEYASADVHAKLHGEIAPGTVTPGSVAKLSITADPAAGFHIYGWAKKLPDGIGSRPTLIVLTDQEGFRATDAKADVEPVEVASDTGEKTYHHDKKVTWTIDLEVPADTKPGEYRIRGIIGFQTCKDTACDFPHAAWFEGSLAVGGQKNDRPVRLKFWKGKYNEAAKLAKGEALPAAKNTSSLPPVERSSDNSSVIPQFKIRELNSATSESLVIVLASAFVGGFILNFMPCVLPVIGLKILSFVEQSGHHRRQVFMLNLWYSLGLLSVFLALAVLASAASLGLHDKNLAWGEQFNSPAFNIVMCGIVFAMALSFMGIWEIPIPGFAGSGNAAKLAAKEGAAGAFAKGVLSTVLATPCSGPLLGSVFGFTLRQSPPVTFTIFGMIGLGMASPYLLIGAFPRLIRFLPKPGAWMDTFKHLMGFVLLGTVVFLFTFLKSEYIVPTFGMLIGIWAACWLIGRVSLGAELGQKLRAWGVGAATAAVVGWVSFSLLAPGADKLPWKPFTPEALAKYQTEGKTVMVDFTASWCLSCKTNLKLAINTDDVLQVVKENDVVPLLADFSDVEGSPDVKAMLEALNSNAIPVLAVFPADRPGEALVLRDLITKGQVIDALRKAGPSKPALSVTGTAMN